MMKGCVYYEAGSVKCFPQETAIQPDNQFPVSHADMLRAYTEGTLEVHPPLANFEHKLRHAIKNSKTLDERHRERLLATLG